MKVKIYKPVKSATQSGKKNTKSWILEYLEEDKTRSIDNLTGWTSSNNTQTQIKLNFFDKEEAINYAKKNNFQYFARKRRIYFY